jgi:O-antigen/teichoic acid export membrane protein
MTNTETPLNKEGPNQVLSQDFKTAIWQGGELIRDSLINYGSLVICGVVGLLLVPAMVHGLGVPAYGLWITANAIATLFSAMDFGVGWAVTREVGAVRQVEIPIDTGRFVRSAANVAILLAVCCTVATTLVAIPMSARLQLTPGLGRVAPVVFFLAGVTLAGDFLFDYTSCVLAGLGRFGVIAFFSACGTTLRAGGVIFLLSQKASLVVVATWWAVCQLSVAISSLVVVGRIRPSYSFELRWPRWRSLSPHISFSLMSMVVTTLHQVFWTLPTLMIPLLRGSAALVPYHLGQKLPTASQWFSRSGGRVLYASSGICSQSAEEDLHMLRVAMRWNALIMLPASVIFIVFARVLLGLWLGQPSPESLTVMRIVSATVFLDSLCSPALFFLWGRGSVKLILHLAMIGLITSIGTGLLLVRTLGVSGAAWGLFIGVVAMAVPLTYVIFRRYGLAISTLADGARGFTFSGILCVVTSISVMYFVTPSNWLSLLASILPCVLLFLASFYMWGATVGERMAVWNVLNSFGQRVHE